MNMDRYGLGCLFWMRVWVARVVVFRIRICWIMEDFQDWGNNINKQYWYRCGGGRHSGLEAESTGGVNISCLSEQSEESIF